MSSLRDERTRPTLVSSLGDVSNSVCVDETAGLLDMGNESCVWALIKALSDPYFHVREQAILTLAKIRDRRAIEPIIGIPDDEAPLVRIAVDSLSLACV